MDMDRSGLLADEDANKGIKKPLFGWEGGGYEMWVCMARAGKKGEKGGFWLSVCGRKA